METPTKSWQEELAEKLEKIPEEHRQRVHDYLVGYIAAIKEEQRRPIKTA